MAAHAYLFPDNTVLCNFAAVERLDLLRSALAGRGRWTDAVAYEASQSAAKLPALGMLPLEGWLGEPIRVTDPAEISHVGRIRRLMADGTNSGPLKHLGQAQTCHVIKNWESLAGSWWISDDRHSLRYARRQGIPVRETIDIVRIAVADGHLTPAAAFDLMTQMAALDRHPRLPTSPDDLSS